MYNIIITLCTIFPWVVHGYRGLCNGKTKLHLIEGLVVDVTTEFFTTTHISPCDYPNPNVEPIPFDPIRQLKNVNVLFVKDIVWPPLPETQLTMVEFLNVTPHGGWGACTHLTSLYIIGGNFTMMSQDWLRNCTQLRYIYTANLSVKQIRAIFDSVTQVEEVILHYITDLDDVFNYPIFTKSYYFFKEISILGGSYNNDTNVDWPKVSAALTLQLSQLPRLEDLKIDLHGFDMCQRGNVSSVTFESLRKLNVLDTNTTRVCFRQYLKIPQLNYLFIGPNVDIEFGELFSNSVLHDLKVNSLYGTENCHLHNCHCNLYFSRTDYLALSNMPNRADIRLGADVSVDCNRRCYGDTFWFARTMHMGLVKFENLVCENGNQYIKPQCERLECERVSCEGGCVCCRVAGDAVVADCRDANLTALPAALLRLDNLTELLAPNNNIASLPDTLPDTLLRLDLSGNRIQLEASEASALFAVRARRVRLAGNPLVCSCDNQPLLNASRYGHVQIDDVEEVKCVNNEKKFLTLQKVCEYHEVNTTLAKEIHSNEYIKKLADDRETQLVITATTTTMLAIVALVLGVALYYRRTIQIILFARGWCLCWLRDDDSDEDRRYDVFLSFCHEDAELVLDQILPTLDQHYSVCIHLRDWIPGDMIPSHIRRSVEESRKTLVILSKHFAKSLWGLMEFQTAYASGLNERRIRVVMVVLDDVLESPDLHKDFQEYVRYNTYVQWGDPWFWSKLRYALPHHTTVHISSQANRPARYTALAIQDAETTEPFEGRLQEAILPLHSSSDERRSECQPTLCDAAQRGVQLPEAILLRHTSINDIDPEDHLSVHDAGPRGIEALEVPPLHISSPDDTSV